DQDGVIGPAFAPDGRRLAVVIAADDGSSDIWIVDQRSGKRTRVTKGLQAASPCWSQDGTWLAYFAVSDYQFQLWAVPMVGSVPGDPIKLIDAKGLDPTSGCSWSSN